MITHLHGDQGQNYKIWLILCKMVGYSVECFSQPIVHVECKCLIGSGSAKHCHSYAALLILLGVRYNRGARAVHLIGMGWYQGCQRGRCAGLAAILDARCAVAWEVRSLDDWRTKKKMAIECVRMMGKNNRWQSCASEWKFRKFTGKLTQFRKLKGKLNFGS
jgi:hypothetical protein